MGNASFGGKMDELPVGDYPAVIRAVELAEGSDFKDPTKKKLQFAFTCDLKVNGGVETRKIWTSRQITDMATVKNPQFVSGLNRLLRACEREVPQTREAVEEWDEQSLIGARFVLRMVEDEETGTVVKRFVPYKKAAAPAAPAAPPPPADDDEDPFSDS